LAIPACQATKSVWAGGPKTIEVKASHLSPISHPDDITQLILEAAGQQA
jgi:hypothetical protein